jgi:bifunctional polynucleotide phosphatase/kinase
MVGRAASGKSTFVKRNILPHGYEHVNQDTCKTEANCKKAVATALSSGKSAVVDNTNGGKDKRKLFISIAKEHNVPVRCIHMQTPRELCEHNNQYRERFHGIPHVPGVAYAMFEKGFQEPSLSEGFTEIIKANFAPAFDNDKAKEEYTQFT